MSRQPTRASMTYATALNRNELYASIPLRDEPPTVLHPDEEVLLVLPGVAGDFPDVIVVTAARTLLIKVGGIVKRASIKREAPAAQVIGVSYRRGLLSRVKISVAGGRDLGMTPSTADDAERFVRELDHLIRTGGLPS